MELIIFGLLIGGSVGTALLFNRLVKHRNYVRDAWAGIEVHLTKRHDLVPLLVKTRIGYQNLCQLITQMKLRGLPEHVANYRRRSRD